MHPRVNAGGLRPAYLATLGYMTAWHVVLPLLPLHAGALGATPVLVGLLVSLMTGVSFFFCLHLGALADQWGARRLAQISSLLYAGALAVMVLARDLRVLALGLAAFGVSDIALVIAIEAHVAAATPVRERPRAFTTLALWASAGPLLGPAVGGAVALRWGFGAAFGAALVIALGVIAASWRIPGRAGAPPSGLLSPAAIAGAAGAILRDRAILFILLMSFAAMFAYSLRQSFYPVFLRDAGFSTAAIGGLMSILGFATLMTRPVLPPALRWLGPVRLLAVVFGLLIVGLGSTPALTTFWAVAGALSLLGIAMGLMGPLSTTLIADRAAEGTYGSAISLRVMALQCSQLLSPTSAGLVVSRYGLAAAFYLAAAVAAGGLLAVVGFARAASRARPARTGAFSPSAAGAGSGATGRGA